MSVRTATPDDVPVMVRLVHELADYEKAADECGLTEEQLHAALFGPDPSAGALVATGDDGAVVGTAIWFRTFSTWEGVAGIHLEDLYVTPAARGGGHGAALLAELAAEVARRGWKRLEWNVLDWNTPAIGFYRSVGAVPNEGWTTYRLTGDPLVALAGRAGR
ncbi:putative acetyltransferase [Pseudonocardia sp. Ae406_Ps2]|uniref:GNAT family N-acetyltransferase n=2 Tax=unclassified Pseudonocardia TaxID=2619320 RepID=UPI0003046BFF|nr:putative acetyltransferase [Pseudonocardia sp. Ae331_Ps2]OLM04904.1 putative acetyltransferase [Pseudonocardia sp. Ae406_Ps2]OLM10263.1 putative acetyltransferase [Pseudonocardia sp. Ae505_Ps2]OLM26476.1 putative acetyltransferase [Pseudonocardia sp. Ae706_Ps2]OLM33438.1 putative acetyltransferase [Pseudonocardia sp. Ae717_Ps2]